MDAPVQNKFFPTSYVFFLETRMYSSRVRTARSLPLGASVHGGYLYMGMSLPRGVSVRETSSPCGQTDICENIALPQTSFAGGNN